MTNTESRTVPAIMMVVGVVAALSAMLVPSCTSTASQFKPVPFEVDPEVAVIAAESVESTIAVLYAEARESGDLDGDGKALYDLAVWTAGQLRAVVSDGNVEEAKLVAALTDLRGLRDPFREWATGKGWEPTHVEAAIASIRLGTAVLRSAVHE